MSTQRSRRRPPRRVALWVLVALGIPWALGLPLGPSGSRAVEAQVTPELQKEINVAIDRGAAWLKKQRSGDGMFDAILFNGQPRHEIGLASLCGLALLATGEAKNDPGMLRTLEALKKRDVADAMNGTRSTYGTGCLLMFITEMYRPEYKPEKDAGRYAKAKQKDPCGLPKDMFAWVQDLASWLVDKQLDDGLWRYPISPPGDLSNSQYALLGLRAARDCGAAVPASKFLKTLERTLGAQEPDGPKHKRIIVGSGKPGETDYAVDSGDRARGFDYLGTHTGSISGSMTTAGIASLAICRDALLKPERFSAYSDELDRKVQRSVQDGFAWLDLRFAVDKNPGRDAPNWHYYYLYGLERACVFGGRELIGKHDWYAESATYLVKQQKPDGSWNTGSAGAIREVAPSDICDTAWALLILKRATRPVLPVPAPVVTSGG